MEETCHHFLEDGRKFLKTARGGVNRPNIFTGDILYNILAMAIEKTIMGMLVFHGTLADNHTFSDLLDSLSRVMTIDAKLVDDLREFERYQTICSPFDGYLRKPLTSEVIQRMIATAESLDALAKRMVNH